MLYAAFKPLAEVHGFHEDKVIAFNPDMREKICALQEKMETMESAIDTLKVSHYFAPSTYAREMVIPAGTTVIGKIHKHSHLNIISVGRVVVTTEEGSEEIVAPHTFTSTAGTKRAVYAVEDTTWTTIHITDETDLDKIEAEIIAKDYSDLVITHDKKEVLI